MTIKTSNPQPHAVERINKKKEDRHPTNLNGIEMDKDQKKKDDMVKKRNKNKGEQ